MSVEARLSVIAEIARRMKTDNVLQFGDDPDESKADIMGFCVGVRDGKQLFLAYHGPGPLSARECIYWSALFLSCDEIFSVADARYKSYEMPVDGPDVLVPKSPEQREEEFYRRHPEVVPGALGEAWESGEREGIKECLQISRYPRVGTPTIATYAYERVGRKIVWGHVMNNPLESHSGAIDDYAKEAFRKRKEIQPEIDEALRQVHADMAKQDFSAAERKYWTDRGMAKHLSTRSGIFLVAYMGGIPNKGLPDVSFKDGEEIDPNTL